MTTSSTELYHISPTHLRELGLEGTIRNRSTAYQGHNELAHYTEDQRTATYDALKRSISENGFNPKHPITIMLNRNNTKDQIFQGHHRLNIAIELNLATVPIKFIYHTAETCNNNNT